MEVRAISPLQKFLWNRISVQNKIGKNEMKEDITEK